MQDKNPVTGKTGYFFEDTDTLHFPDKSVGRRVRSIEIFRGIGNLKCRHGK